MKNKFTMFFVLAFISLLVLTLGTLSTSVKADSWQETNPDISEMTVYVNSNVVWYSYCDPVSESCFAYQYEVPALERGKPLNVRAVFKPNTDLSEISVKAWINGYRNEIKDRSSEFDAFKDNLYTKTFSLAIPEDIDARDEYTLYVKIESNKELKGADEAKIETDVQRTSNLLKILSTKLYDNSYKNTETFETGSTLYGDVVVKNTGNHVLEDVYVKVSIPELSVERTLYLGDLGSYDNQYQDAKKITFALTTPEKEGTYELNIEAFNSEVRTKETKTIVLEHKVGHNVKVVPQITEASLKDGKAEYSIIVSNIGESSERISVEIVGADWANIKISPALFDLASGESKTIGISLDAKEKMAKGNYPFTVKVKYGNEIKQFNFETEVGSSNWKTVLAIIGIVIAVAIIVLLAILLAKQRSSNEEEKSESAESYY